METNVYGPYELCRTLLPLMEANHYGRVVNLSSRMGQLSEMNAGYPGYRISKTALNAVTRIFAEEVSGQNILINSACPGWVATEMGGKTAPRTVEQGADTVVWLATLPDGGPTGGFFRDRSPIPW
jgi:NAD(P)-dependent dehydrogenase (short-subunit alcohol dehydrogenase family)